jgi:glycosyltransferase involved in cell wall biosynthesis
MTTSLPTVSVVLATYHGDRFLLAQLESLNQQTHKPAELIVGDDLSSDDTISILSSFRERAAFPVFMKVNQQRLHFGENFLINSLQARSKYVAYCDQDDIWRPEKLAMCVSALERSNAVLCSHDADVIDAAGNIVGKFTQLQRGLHPPLTLSPWNVLFGFTLVFRRSLLDIWPHSDRGPDNIDFQRLLAHDRWIYFLSQTFGNIIHLDDPLVLYRQHSGNLFGKEQRTTVGAKLKKLLTTHPAYLSHHLEICRHRVSLLRSLPNPASSDLQAMALRGEEYWKKMANIYERRLALVTGRKLTTRVAELRRLIKLSAYAPFNQWGLTGRAFIKDLSCLVTTGGKT